MQWVFKKDELDQVVTQFWSHFQAPRVFAFRGEMGAGKTTFITALCHHLGVKDTISSPTFSIINEYGSSQGPVYHIDLYRLKDEMEAMQAGVEDVFYSGSICFVEWPERAASLFPADAVWLEFEQVDMDTRKLRESAPYNGSHL